MSYLDKNVKDLYRAILSLKTEKEAEAFFRDLLTIGEIKEFSERWQMVRLLAAGKSYLEVAGLTNSSTTTVTRVAHWLNHGMGGYKLILKKINNIK